jgi:hypothetical protein
VFSEMAGNGASAKNWAADALFVDDPGRTSEPNSAVELLELDRERLL